MRARFLPWATGCASAFCLSAVLFANELEPVTAPAAEAVPAGPAETVARMRAAQERIGRSETGEETQAIQRQILADLDALIASGSGSSGSDEPAADAPKPEEQPAAPEGDSDGTEAGSGETLTTPPADSDEQAQTADSAQAARARREKLVGEIWGHLPERIRRELLNVSADEPLPQYADLVRDYFEALATPERDRTSAPPPAGRRD